ncbi:MAG TPA: MmcQ/YjbR family DNA-binding protein [Gammaproteobacteria bacterium]|nr:MmcQ/YjbR family DNA-binding protein [Gammaproteobacteria bacterium]
MRNTKSARRRPLTFADVRDIALSMPEVTETTSWGMPTFKAGKTTFAVEPHPRPDVVPNSLGVPMSFEERAKLLASRPDVYYLTDHWAKYPGVLLRLSSIGRDELREILTGAWHYAMQRESAKRPRRKGTARARAVRR